MAVISSVMAKICLQTAIFHSSIEDAITNTTVISDQNCVGKDNELSMEPSFDV